MKYRKLVSKAFVIVAVAMLVISSVLFTFVSFDMSNQANQSSGDVNTGIVTT